MHRLEKTERVIWFGEAKERRQGSEEEASFSRAVAREGLIPHKDKSRVRGWDSDQKWR